MNGSYWDKVLRSRINRRRLLAASGAGAGAAFLAACSGDNNSSGGGNTSGLIAETVDSTKEAKRGGIYKSYAPADARTWDPYPSGIGGTNPHNHYSRLLSIRPGILESSSGIIDPDMALSWEFTPDRLQLTLKLRADAIWDLRAPTNGRAVDAEDVVFSWNRFMRTSALRANYANSVSPDAPIVSVTAADARTVVMKLAQPDSALETLLAANGARSFHLLPREIEQVDIRNAPRGSGPFFMAEHNPSVGYTFERRANYYEKDLPYVDKFERPVIAEYATALAQFKAGRIYDMGEELSPEDVLPTKRDVPQLLLYQNDVTVDPARTFYGMIDGPTAPFKDERLRQAFSMSIDKDLWIDTFYNVPGFESEGLPVEKRWNSAIHAVAEGWWIDPQDSKTFGSNAKYYEYNVAEAKKLVEAAGFKNGLTTNANYIQTAQFGVDFPQQVQVLIGMAKEAGINFTTVPVDYATDWDSKYRTTTPPGNFDGAAWVDLSLADDFGSWLYSVYHSKGAHFKGFDPNGRGTRAGDPRMDELTQKIKTEFDLQARMKLAHDLQRHEAQKQYMTPFPGGASGFLLAWPALRNFRVYRGPIGLPLRPEVYYWIDSTKAPLTNA